ncbi:MAG: hypothetical protein IT158_15485 [Bryobacterales bacterium]|nr:hypothetical protein [Bryobacterales bacterium]
MHTLVHRVITALLTLAVALPLTAAQPAPAIPVVTAGGTEPVPQWALLQRQLIRAMNEAAPLYWSAFTERGGALRRSGKLDDDLESFASWPLFYAIGGDEWLLDRSLEAFSAIARQWSYERGSMRGEFPKHYDMLHTSEGYVGFQYFGLADPGIRENVARAKRFAGYYLGEDPEAPNYDPRHKIIRSPLNGSAGPEFHSDAGYVLDYGHASLHPLVPKLERGWAKDPARAREIQKMYDDVVLRGDVIMNLAVTGLVTHAYLLTGEEKYKRWVLEYVDAWMARTRENGGIIPDNIGLTGRIGEYRKGQWWGGFFGWTGRYSLEMIFNSLITASECAYLLSGDARYLDLLRSQIDVLLAQAVVRGGDLLVPFRYGPGGWEDFRPLEPYVVSHLWHASLSEADWKRVERILKGAKHGPYAYAYADSPNAPDPGAEAWRPDGTLIDWNFVLSDVPHRNQNRRNEAPHLMYLAGSNPDWPVKVMQAEYQQVMRCVDRIRGGTWEHLWKSQTVTEQNPVVTNGLTQAAMGAPFPCFNGGLLRAQVRYFDALRKRPGLPEDTAALVEAIDARGIRLTLVNTGAVHERRVIVQAGAFGEHTFTEVNGAPVGGRHIEVRLPAGKTARLRLGMTRYGASVSGYTTPKFR